MSTKCEGNCGKKLQCKECDGTGGVCSCIIGSDLKIQYEYEYVSVCIHKCNNDCGNIMQCDRCGKISGSCWCSITAPFHDIPSCVHKCNNDCGEIKKIICRNCSGMYSICSCISSDLKQYQVVHSCLHKCKNDCGYNLQCGRCGAMNCSCFCPLTGQYNKIPACTH